MAKFGHKQTLQHCKSAAWLLIPGPTRNLGGCGDGLWRQGTLRIGRKCPIGHGARNHATNLGVI
eukprot:507473-Lingulodinium_polyedra.AAC.1